MDPCAAHQSTLAGCLTAGTQPSHGLWLAGLAATAFRHMKQMASDVQWSLAPGLLCACEQGDTNITRSLLEPGTVHGDPCCQACPTQACTIWIWSQVAWVHSPGDRRCLVKEYSWPQRKVAGYTDMSSCAEVERLVADCLHIVMLDLSIQDMGCRSWATRTGGR